VHYWSIDATVNILFVCVAIWRINRTLQQVSESYVVNGHSRYAHCTMCHLGLMHIVRPYTVYHTRRLADGRSCRYT